MNVQSALKILREEGYRIEKLEDGNYSWDLITEKEILSPRQLIKMARSYTSYGNRCSIKENLKHFDKRRNRQKTNQAISHEEFDKFPKGKIHKENVWSWD